MGPGLSPIKYVTAHDKYLKVIMIMEHYIKLLTIFI